MANSKKRPAKSGGVPRWIYLLLGVLVLAVAYRLLAPREAEAAHPDPRPGVTAEKVLPAFRFAGEPEVADVYEMARQIPDVIDGIYCYCDCHKHYGHRSLLSCFESEHGSGCDVCMQEVVMAYRMHQQGKTLQQIRAAIDASFGHA